jgi:hypothetical protein
MCLTVEAGSSSQLRVGRGVGGGGGRGIREGSNKRTVGGGGAASCRATYHYIPSSLLSD